MREDMALKIQLPESRVQVGIHFFCRGLKINEGAKSLGL
ncbi:unnamed protein product [Cylicostephanus goldi]|uniref:Uncharacterized protein n=1 Tax=Cylicostephanus goldi TaxID=71465 RepID=A0A3P7NP43_CYLGO|nr:unnamed protein product [Cylicostephanus goldi]